MVAANMKTAGMIKGCERLLTAEDISALIGKPVRFVREMLNRGEMKGMKFGGNSWRVHPRAYMAYVERGATGFNGATPSGCRRQKEA